MPFFLGLAGKKVKGDQGRGNCDEIFGAEENHNFRNELPDDYCLKDKLYWSLL